MGNRLASEKSPYLLQHAQNPVDWYPWCDEAFLQAALQNKPVFLSIGYSTCHWCHVMAHESFEDQDVACLMNDAFICIKVDREERPDIDSTYMTACQIMTQSGGWPLTIIMTPDKKPFFAATYISKQSRFGRVGMLDLIPRIKSLWTVKHTDVLKAAEDITAVLRDIAQADPDKVLDNAVLHAAYQSLSDSFDSRHGGFGNAPKFPTPHNLMFLLRYWIRTSEPMALHMVETTLQNMRCGGIYDHIGFGFHRYSTDSHWLVPHFEKMLYDQALLCMAYTEAYQATGNSLYATTVCEIITYVLRDMTSPVGGFYSAEDADSAKEEGKFYIWSASEIQKALSSIDSDLFCRIFNIQQNGNFSDESTGIQKKLNILHMRASIKDLAANLKISDSELIKTVEKLCKRLFNHRKKRPHPHKDDKILTDWNGLMIAACAKAGRALGNRKFISAAVNAVDFILSNMLSANGRLLHRYRDTSAAISGQASDYAFFVWGLIELYEATFDVQYLEAACRYTTDFINHFWDDNNGGFYTVADDAEPLIVRQKEIYDGALPSPNAVAMLNLLRLSRMTGNADYEKKAASISRAFSRSVRQAPSAHTMLMIAQDFASTPGKEIVIIGKETDLDTKKMLTALSIRFMPYAITLFRPSNAKNHALNDLCPFIRPMQALNGSATAYVCTNFSCSSPTTDKAIMLNLLSKH